jgi:hypothetical protein
MLHKLATAQEKAAHPPWSHQMPGLKVYSVIVIKGAKL